MTRRVDPTGARRQAIRRARRDAGISVLGVEVTASLADDLVDLGWLPADRRRDRAAIAFALRKILEDTIRSGVTRDEAVG